VGDYATSRIIRTCEILEKLRVAEKLGFIDDRITSCVYCPGAFLAGAAEEN
jgi:hypothetical protein